MRILIFSCLLVSALIIDCIGTDHNYFWRDYRGTIPNDAYSFEGLYIAQVPYNGILPATLYAEKKEAVSECQGGKIVVSSGIKLLCDRISESFYWEHANVNKLDDLKLENCVMGGIEDGSTLYVGKVYHEGEWKIGKVFPPTSQWKGLRVWYNNGDKYVTEDFEILRYRTLGANIFNVRDKTA